MTVSKSEAAAILGRLGGLKGGKSRSKAKVAAARQNGCKGGWPKGKKRKTVTVKIEGAEKLYRLINVTMPAQAKRIAEKALRDVAEREFWPKGKKRGKR